MATSVQHFDVVRASEASAELAEQQTLGFYNDREHARVGVYKINAGNRQLSGRCRVQPVHP